MSTRTGLHSRSRGTAVESPCVDICRIDPANGLCIGCQRTIEEIVHWGAMDDDDRRTVMARVAQRRDAGPRAAG